MLDCMSDGAEPWKANLKNPTAWRYPENVLHKADRNRLLLWQKTSKTKPVNPKEREKIWTHYCLKTPLKTLTILMHLEFYHQNFCPLSRENNSHCRVCGTQEWLQSPMYRSVKLRNASAWPGQTSQSITDILISTLTIGLSYKLNYNC